MRDIRPLTSSPARLLNISLYRSAVMYSNRTPTTRFDVVDLDPYGTATPFIDGAVQCVNDGGKSFISITVVRRR